MMHPQPLTDHSAPIVELDHDHDDLTVLLQDLHVQVRQAMVDESRSRALGEARQLLRYFREDMQSHFNREETLLFPTLREHLPKRAQVVDGLARAHEHFDRLVVDIAQRLSDEGSSRDRIHEGLDMIDRLALLFEGHSKIECDLIDAMDAVVRSPQLRAQLRQKLSEL